MMRPPERVVWSPHRVDQEDAWISEDGAWILILRSQLDQIRAGQPTEEIRVEDPSIPIRFSDPDPTVRIARKFTPDEIAAAAEREAPPAPAPAPAAPPAASDRARPFLAISAVVLALATGAWLGMTLERTRTVAPPPATPCPPPVAADVAPPPPPAAPSEAPTPPSPRPPRAPSAPSAEAPPTRPTAPAARAWAVVERDPAAALDLFEEAMADGAGLDAAHGYGYALLKLGRGQQAKPYLCRARGLGGDTRREIDVLLARNGLSCN
jgi:hypothetical protein